jgi:uncharacterized protein
MILIDAGYLIALLDKNDRHHARAVSLLPTRSEGWISTWPVLTEAIYMLQTRVHINCALGVLDAIDEGDISVWPMPQTATKRIKSLMNQYRNLPMDLADASLVLLAEHQGEGRILTTDQRDFGLYRWKAQKPFVDLMAA